MVEKLSGQREKNRDFPELDSVGRRREKVRADIAKRIGRVCGHFSEKELTELVDLMTDRQIRGERRDTSW
ncbi:MAG TPA: hypothetical protein VIH53_08080 [Gemmatimonadaceae bacterium]